MLTLNEIKTGKLISIGDEPYAVIKAAHHKIARGGAVLKSRLKNLITGSILDKTFQGNERVAEAEIEKRKANLMYKNGGEAHFMDSVSYEQFSIALERIGGKERFLKEGADLDLLYFQNKPIAVDLPVKIDLRVVSAPPGVRGNSAGSVTKTVELETGAKINAPLFVNEGDVVRVNTETGEYVERM